MGALSCSYVEKYIMFFRFCKHVNRGCLFNWHYKVTGVAPLCGRLSLSQSTVNHMMSCLTLSSLYRCGALVWPSHRLCSWQTSIAVTSQTSSETVCRPSPQTWPSSRQDAAVVCSRLTSVWRQCSETSCRYCHLSHLCLTCLFIYGWCSYHVRTYLSSHTEH